MLASQRLSPKGAPIPLFGLRRDLWPITTCHRDHGREAWPFLPRKAILSPLPRERAARHLPALAAGLCCGTRRRAGHLAGAWPAV